MSKGFIENNSDLCANLGETNLTSVRDCDNDWAK